MHKEKMAQLFAFEQLIINTEEAQEEEEDLLDKAWGLAPNSRLGCQALVAKQDLVIEIPRYTINHAKENH